MLQPRSFGVPHILISYTGITKLLRLTPNAYAVTKPESPCVFTGSGGLPLRLVSNRSVAYSPPRPIG
jgi:hypothetical protein